MHKNLHNLQISRFKSVPRIQFFAFFVSICWADFILTVQYVPPRLNVSSKKDTSDSKLLGMPNSSSKMANASACVAFNKSVFPVYKYFKTDLKTDKGTGLALERSPL